MEKYGGRSDGKDSQRFGGNRVFGKFGEKRRKIVPLGLWTLGVVVYWLIAPNGNLTHQYYADVYIPLVVVLAAIGLNFIFEKIKSWGY